MCVYIYISVCVYVVYMIQIKRLAETYRSAWDAPGCVIWGVPEMGISGISQNGWLISWKIHKWMMMIWGVPSFQETPIWLWDGMGQIAG